MSAAEVEVAAGGRAARRRGLARWLTPAERERMRGRRADVERLALHRAQAGGAAADLIETWLAGIDADTTREAYATDVRLFVEWLRDRWQVDDSTPVNLLAVSYDVAAAYADAMRRMTGRYGKPLSPQTRARRISSLRALYRHLVQRRVLEANPLTDLPRPKTDPAGVTDARSAEELAAMLGAAAESGPADLLLLALACSTALRVSELVRARVEDVSMAGGRCLLRVPIKGGKDRQVPLDPAVCELLERDGRSAGPLLPDRRPGHEGEALDRHQIAYALCRLATAAGLDAPERVTPHVLRTSAATHWLESGVPLQKVQHKLNHSSPTTTNRYHRRRKGIADDAALGATLLADLGVDDALARLRTP